MSKESPPFRLGERVILNVPPGRAPRFGWGGAKNGDIGVIREYYRNGSYWVVVVDFPNHSCWKADPDELVSIWGIY